MVENLVGDPVYVAGDIGEGRAVFTGSYYGYTSDPAGPERRAFLGCLDDWRESEVRPALQLESTVSYLLLGPSCLEAKRY